MADEQLEALLRQTKATPKDGAAWLALARAQARAGRDPGASLVEAARLEHPDTLAVALQVDAPLAVLPAGPRRALVVSDGRRAARAFELPLSARRPVAYDRDRQLLAGFAGDAHELVVIDLRRPHAPQRLALPDRRSGHAVAIHGPAVYAGSDTELLLVAALDDLAAGWRRIESARGQAIDGKAIDALLVDGDRLIAVDNIVMPKFHFLFDVTDPLQPRFLRSAEMPWHYTYERVTGAALSPDHLVVLSAGAGRGGSLAFIALYGRDDLEERVHLSQARSGDGPRNHDWHAIATLEHLLLVAAGVDGLGLLDLRTPGPEPTLRPVPLELPPTAEVVDVAPLPDRDHVVLAVGLYTTAELAQPGYERGQPQRTVYRVASHAALRAALES